MSPERRNPLLLEPIPYSPLIPAGLHVQYLAALASVQRWQGNDFCPDVMETDYDHILAMFKISDELRQRQPLARAVNFDDVNHMIYVHDGGEVLVGDLALGRPDYSQVRERFKKREKAAIRLLIRKIHDPETRKSYLAYSQRYENVPAEDNEALVAHLIDKLQAIRFGVIHVFNGYTLGEIVGGQAVDRSFNKIINHFKLLMNNLPSDARGDFSNFMREEIDKVGEHGYRTKAEEYKVRFGLVDYIQLNMIGRRNGQL